MSASASDSDDAAKWHFEYCYCPLFMSSGVTEVYVGKLHSRGKYFKLGNNLFKFISLRDEHEMQRQYFICVKLCKETGGLVHASQVHISYNAFVSFVLQCLSSSSSSLPLDVRLRLKKKGKSCRGANSK